MAEVLNEHFSSVLTTEDISSLPDPFTKFEDNKSEHLGQLFVTPEMIAKKIKKMKDNKSPGVDGIPPKLLKEIVEQISTPLAKVFNLSLEQEIVPSEWKETNITPLFKKGSSNKPKNYRPVSLTSVVWFPKSNVMSNQSVFLEEITKWVDDGSPVDLDFQKAFDKVPHQRLLLKLKPHGMM